jgi:hypothetical protein
VFFFGFFLKKWIKLFWATSPMIKEREKGFANGLIVPGDLPDEE